MQFQFKCSNIALARRPVKYFIIIRTESILFGFLMVQPQWPMHVLFIRDSDIIWRKFLNFILLRVELHFDSIYE